ncbi:MAG: RND transporter, partial [Proteobacteria bacterium]
PVKKSALGIGEHLAKWDERANRQESYPTGYFANPESTLLGIRIVSNTYLGDPRADRLLATVGAMIEEAQPKQFDPAMEVGLTGDLAAAAGEKKALMDEAIVATMLALSVIMLGIAFFYRSAWALVVMVVPVAFGISAAYAFARFQLGYINAAGAFLGAILLGNGINYPIVLLSRYQDFLARGADPAEAKRAAVYNAMRAEFVGACVASIAYGSLTISDFRGFSQFGMIGFVGMLLVWLAIIPVVPALLAAIEALNPKLPSYLRMGVPKLRSDGSRSRTLSLVAKVTYTYPWFFVLVTVVITARAVWHLPEYFADPWEYDFGKMGSKSSDQSGAGAWSDKANHVFGKTNIAGARMIADNPGQVPQIKTVMLARDATDPQGKMLEDVVTVYDLLPGDEELQKKKLEVLERIRDRITPRVLQELDDSERATAERAIPPEDLRVLTPADLPPLMSRRFSDSTGAVGTVFYVQPKRVNFADAHNHLRLSKTIDNVELPDKTVVLTASRSTIFAEILTSMRKDGPRLSLVAFGAVALVVLLAARNVKTAGAVLLSLLLGVVWLAGATAYFGERINYVNFIAYPITFGIGSEYPFNIADRTRLLGGNVREAVVRSAGAVMLCSFTTTVGYASMLYSDFQSLVSFGKLAVVGEIACLYTAIFFLPSLLTLIERAKRAG